MKKNQQIYSFELMWFEQCSPQHKKPASHSIHEIKTCLTDRRIFDVIFGTWASENGIG